MKSRNEVVADKLLGPLMLMTQSSQHSQAQRNAFTLGELLPIVAFETEMKR